MPPSDDSIGRYPAAIRGWWAVALFGVAAVLSYTDRQILALLVDPIRGDLGISDVEISVLQGAAFAVLYSFVGLPLGRIADLVPRRALLIFAVILWSLGTILCGLAHSFAALFAARLLVGVGEAALAPAAMSLIGDYFPPTKRALPTGVFFTGMIVGGGSAVAIGGFLLGAAQHALFAQVPFVSSLAPCRVVLIVLGVAGLGLVLFFFTIREPNERHASLAELRGHLFSVGEVTGALRSQWTVLLPLYAAMAIGSIVDYATMSWMPALLSRRFALTPNEIGASLGAVAIAAGLIGTPLGGIMADWTAKRFGPLTRIRLCGFIMLLGIFGIPVGILSTATLSLASAFAWTLVSATAGTIGIATTLDLLPQESRGLGTATIAFCNTIVGLGLGPTLVALATDHVYGDPSRVGMALSTVAAPAIVACCLLFFVAARAASGTLNAIARA